MNTDSIGIAPISRSAAFRNDPVRVYRAKKTVALSMIPLICGIALILLLRVFTKLNLYFLESNGLIVNEDIRSAYYSLVSEEVINVLGYVALDLMIAAVTAYVIMRWATAPFQNGVKLIRTAMNNPKDLQPQSRFLSESPFFDHCLWNFALAVKNEKRVEMPRVIPNPGLNWLFLLKFFCSFGIISIITGYVMGIQIIAVYQEIVRLSLQLIQKPIGTQHYFLAQQEILVDASILITTISMVIYFFYGLKISGYMSSMSFVFSRAIVEHRFPVTLRKGDIYTELARTLDEAHLKIESTITINK